MAEDTKKDSKLVQQKAQQKEERAEKQQVQKRDDTVNNFGGGLWSLLLVWAIVSASVMLIQSMQVVHLPYSDFVKYLNTGRLKEVTMTNQQVQGTFVDPKSGKTRDFDTWLVQLDLADRLAAKNIVFSHSPDTGWVAWVLPVMFFFFLSSYMMNRSQGSPGLGSAFTFGKSRARIYKEEESKVTFNDVAGVDEAKEELQEIVEFLKDPQRYKKLGGRLPKGILLVGPPGTGKTLLARALAGEAKVPFLSITGSEFVELYVGVGAARVRDLFEEAMRKAPCIIFIDELDALGRARGIGPMSGGHDEKEQTLNQLLAELDGFDSRQGVILIAATNRPEIMDPALLRAGRFDRQILVDRPDKIGRVQILNVYLKSVTADATVQAEQIAAMTTGFTGADLANLVNEAALLAARHRAAAVSMENFNEAMERIVAGLEKRNRLLNPQERQVVAHHEMGHALLAISVGSNETVQKVSIIPRGVGALGYTIQRPLEDRFLMTQLELENKLIVLLGGRAAEQIIFGSISTGAADDLAKATALARHMVSKFGMSEKLGLAVYENETGAFLQTAESGLVSSQCCSDETAREIDCAVRDLLEQSFDRALTILEKHRDSLEKGAQRLLEKETLTQEELLDIVLSEDSSSKVADRIAVRSCA